MRQYRFIKNRFQLYEKRKRKMFFNYNKLAEGNPSQKAQLIIFPNKESAHLKSQERIIQLIKK